MQAGAGMADLAGMEASVGIIGAGMLGAHQDIIIGVGIMDLEILELPLQVVEEDLQYMVIIV